MQPVTEIAFFYAQPGREDDFRAAIRQAKTHIESSDGCRSLSVRQGVETPGTFVLTVEWESLEFHQAFRDSERLALWRTPIAPLFDRPPFVEHYALVE